MIKEKVKYIKENIQQRRKEIIEEIKLLRGNHKAGSNHQSILITDHNTSTSDYSTIKTRSYKA
jgi:hypothetical protein